MSFFINVINLKISSENKVLIPDLSFDIYEGECLGVIGESGSGKSLTALFLMNLLPTNLKVSGEFLYQDKKITRSMIFQEPMTALNPVFKIESQLREAFGQNASLEELIEALEQVKIANPRRVLKQYPHQCSGGMRQRILIAMALAKKPKLLIADEPTTALDVTVQAEILILLNELRRTKNFAMLFITHDFRVLKKVADRVMVLYRGQKMEEGPLGDILSHPKTTYTQGLIECIPSLNKKYTQEDELKTLHGKNW